jgi:hypothetical protein
MTHEDLAAIDQAILALATGQRVAEVRIEGQVVRYHDVNLPQLRQLRDEVARQLAGGSGRRLLAHQAGKGL